MEYREIEVTVLSTQDLKNVNLLGGAMTPYPEVWVYKSKKVQTEVCSGGGRNPWWNCALRALACEERLFQSGGEISFVVYNRELFSANTLIGSVAVPLWDLSALCKAADESHPGGSSASTAMSCQIRTKSGKAQGVLNLAVKVRALVKHAEQRYKAPAAENDTTPVMGYPAASPNPRRYRALIDQKKQQDYPPEFHPRYGQPAAYYQQTPSLKLSTWKLTGPDGGRGTVPGLGSPSDGGGGCGGGCG